jgi:hypothetical protein
MTVAGQRQGVNACGCACGSADGQPVEDAVAAFRSARANVQDGAAEGTI